MKKSGCELGILKKERKEYNPSQLTGRSKVEAPFPSQTPGFLPRCIRFRIVSWKQKAGSLCPAFKKLAKFSLKCLSFAQTLPSPSNFAPSLAPLLPFLNFLPPSSSPFLLSIYGFLYLPTTSSRTFPLFFAIPFTRVHFRIILPHLSQSFIHFSSSTSLKPRVFFLRLCLFFTFSFLFFFFFLTFNDAINQGLRRNWRNVETEKKKEK